MTQGSAPQKLTGSEICRALRVRPLRAVPRSSRLHHASVAVVFHLTAKEELALLLIQRAENPQDRWSGHMAFPGGRQQPEDIDLVETARRECQEEVGFDPGEGQFLGSLDPLPARPRLPGRGLVVHPQAFWLDRLPPLALDRREVASALSVPLSILRRGARGTIEWKRGPLAFKLPSIEYRGHTIWGLTLQMLDDFFRRLDEIRL